MRFPEGAPVFAVEVRSENDYGPAAERAMAKRRAPTISPAGRLWCGMWTYWVRTWWRCTGRAILRTRRSTAEATLPRQNQQYRRGDGVVSAKRLSWTLPGWVARRHRMRHATSIRRRFGSLGRFCFPR